MANNFLVEVNDAFTDMTEKLSVIEDAINSVLTSFDDRLDEIEQKLEAPLYKVDPETGSAELVDETKKRARKKRAAKKAAAKAPAKKAAAKKAAAKKADMSPPLIDEPEFIAAVRKFAGISALHVQVVRTALDEVNKKRVNGIAIEKRVAFLDRLDALVEEAS